MRYDFGITMRFKGDEYREAEKILKDKGYTMPESFRMFIKAVIAADGMPFTLIQGNKGRKIRVKNG